MQRSIQGRNRYVRVAELLGHGPELYARGKELRGEDGGRFPPRAQMHRQSRLTEVRGIHRLQHEALRARVKEALVGLY
jgi:hypothetical protein